MIALNYREFKSVGVNRVSLGVQALNERDLEVLGRQHSVKETLRYLLLNDYCSAASVMS